MVYTTAAHSVYLMAVSLVDTSAPVMAATTGLVLVGQMADYLVAY